MELADVLSDVRFGDSARPLELVSVPSTPGESVLQVLDAAWDHLPSAAGILELLLVHLFPDGFQEFPLVFLEVHFGPVLAPVDPRLPCSRE